MNNYADSPEYTRNNAGVMAQKNTIDNRHTQMIDSAFIAAGSNNIRNPSSDTTAFTAKRYQHPSGVAKAPEKLSGAKRKAIRLYRRRQKKALKEQAKRERAKKKRQAEAFKRAERLRLKYDPDVIAAYNEKKRKRRIIRNMLIARFFLVILVYIILMGMIVGGNVWIFRFISKADTDDYTLVINSALDEPTQISLPRSFYYRNGTYYLDMSTVARELDLTATGTLESLRFINADTLDAVYLNDGSTEIIINTVSTRLTAPVICEGDKMLVPLDFFRHYIMGITVEIDTENHIFILNRNITGYNTSMLHGTTPIYEEVTFTLKDPSAMEHIRENSLPTDILYDTDPLRLAEEAVKAAEEARKAEEEARKAQELAAQLGYGSIG